jgi:regulator of protease activity HflC (stomatin/prohibitin superfamily)
MVSMSITVTAPEVGSIREILSNPQPYSDIPKLPQLTTALEQVTKAGRSELEKRANEARMLEEERLRAEAERREAEAEGKAPAEAPKIAKPVRSGDLISRTYSIKSEADIDTMLGELRVKLLQELAENGEVKVI